MPKMNSGFVPFAYWRTPGNQTSTAASTVTKTKCGKKTAARFDRFSTWSRKRWYRAKTPSDTALPHAEIRLRYLWRLTKRLSSQRNTTSSTTAARSGLSYR